MVYNINVSHQQTRDEISQEGQIRFIPKRYTEQAKISTGPRIVETRDTTDDYLWDRDDWDEAYWAEDYTESLELQSVTNYNNVFRHTFQYDKLKGYNDTATWNTSAGTVTVDTGEQLEIVSVYLDSTNTHPAQSILVRATTNNTDLLFEASANGGVTWEAITLNQQHFFTQLGYDLRLRGRILTQFETQDGFTLQTVDEENFLLTGSGTTIVSEIVCSYTLG
jgi:ribosomal protein S18 acetylase RimI-like enzyme